MSPFDESIVVVYAALHPTGAIELELLIPGQDDFTTITIPPTRETRRIARPDVIREISIDFDADPDNKPLREMVQEFVKRAEQKRLDALRQAADGARRA